MSEDFLSFMPRAWILLNHTDERGFETRDERARYIASWRVSTDRGRRGCRLHLFRLFASARHSGESRNPFAGAGECTAAFHSPDNVREPRQKAKGVKMDSVEPSLLGRFRHRNDDASAWSINKNVGTGRDLSLPKHNRSLLAHVKPSSIGAFSTAPSREE